MKGRTRRSLKDYHNLWCERPEAKEDSLVMKLLNSLDRKHFIFASEVGMRE